MFNNLPIQSDDTYESGHMNACAQKYPSTLPEI